MDAMSGGFFLRGRILALAGTPFELPVAQGARIDGALREHRACPEPGGESDRLLA